MIIKNILKYSLIILIIISIIGGIVLYNKIISSNVNKAGIIYITKYDTRKTILDRLYSQGIIKDTTSLSWVMQKKHYSNIRTGKYNIILGMSNNIIVNKLRAGNQDVVDLTFNNIRTKEEFAGKISKLLMVDSLSIITKLNDEEYVNKLGFNTNTVIGMFLPNTYQVYWDITVENFVIRMNREYNLFWTPERIKKAKEASLTPMDAIIIASIVEEETLQKEEYSIIAGVYINRLRKNYLLGACPTLKFAIGDFELKRILDIHKKVDSPYNTYKYRGLPPGPIRQPSVYVIDKVLNYKKHDFLYFCAKEDFSGRHNFAKTLSQHNINAEKYRKELDKRHIFR